MTPNTRRAAVAPSRAPARLAGAGWILLAVSLLVAGCEIEKPVVPTFTTTVTIPIGEERIDVAEIVADEEYLYSGGDSTLAFAIDGEGDTISLDLELGVDIPADSASAEVGVFSLDVADPADFSFTLGELYPEAILLDGMSIVVPAFDFDLASEPAELAEIESATLAAGELRVTLENGLPVPVSGPTPPERISINLVDPQSGTPIATAVFTAAVAPGAQATASADLAGVTLPGSIAVQLTGGSPGSSGPVLIDAQANLGVTAELRGLEVASAVAIIGEQSFDTSYATDLPDSLQLLSAEIASGQLGFRLTNELAIPCQARLIWQEIRTPGGQPLVFALVLAADATTTTSVDLAGHTIESGGAPLTELGLTIEVTSPGSSGQAVQLQAADRLTAVIEPTEIRFGEVTGSLPEQTFALDPVTEEVDLPDELSGVTLTAASLLLQVDNGTGMPAHLDVQLTGTAGGGSRVTMDVFADIAPALGGERQTTSIVLDESNSNIVAFLNNLPTQITLAGEVRAGGEDVVGTIRPNDSAAFAWRIEAPLEVIIENTVLTGDAEELDLGQDTQDLINDHAEGARVITAITNHLPLAVEIRILAGQDPLTLESSPLLIVGPLAVAGGEIDPVLHTVSAATVSNPQIVLSRQEARIFGLSDIHTLVEVTLPGSDGQPVRLRSSDYLSVTGAVSLEVLVTD